MAADEKWWEQSPLADDYDVRNVPAPKSGIPEPGPSSAGEDVSALAKATGRIAKTAAAPTFGSVAVPAAMTALTGPANLPFIPLEQGLGSALGEGFNQLTGITEPSWKQLAASAIIPMATGYGMNALRGAAVLPKELNAKAPQMATQQMQGYRGTPAKTLFEHATQEGVTIPLSGTTTTLQTMRNTIADATPAAKKAFETVLKQTGLEDLATNPNGVTPAQMQYLLADVGKLQAKAAKEGGLQSGYLKRFFASLSDDLEQSGAALAPARAAFKRESVLNEIDDAINGAMFIKKGVGSQSEFSANKILNTLNKTNEGLGKFFSQSFNAAEQKEIKDLFGFLNTLPSLKPGAGQQYGSGQFWNKVANAGAGSGIGAGAGFAMGGPAGAAVGGGLGLMAPEVASMGSTVLQAWTMPGGRQLVRNLLLNKEGLPMPHIAATLSAFVTGGASTPAPPQEIQPPNPTQIQPMRLIP